LPDLQKGRAGVEQMLDAFAGQQLAACLVLVARFSPPPSAALATRSRKS
jgi:hypothetical protein